MLKLPISYGFLANEAIFLSPPNSFFFEVEAETKHESEHEAENVADISDTESTPELEEIKNGY